MGLLELEPFVSLVSHILAKHYFIVRLCGSSDCIRPQRWIPHTRSSCSVRRSFCATSTQIDQFRCWQELGSLPYQTSRGHHVGDPLRRSLFRRTLGVVSQPPQDTKEVAAVGEEGRVARARMLKSLSVEG